MNIRLLIALLLFCTHYSNAQNGCTDPYANNFDENATVNNGSCLYNPTSITLSDKRTLPPQLNENSGLTYTDGNLWTFNDGGNAAAIYRVNETTGAIEQTVTISNATNIDWEAITSDELYIYIGDFGNNVNGNRKDLRIYRVLKSGIGTGTAEQVNAEIINFNYPDQVIQDPITNGPNNTAYDCEAFFIRNNTFHLFTKDWINFKTKHYTLQNTPGTQTASAVEEINVNGLITDAAMSSNGEIVLAGYQSNLLGLFIWLFYDYNEELFFSGNKRQFQLGSSFTNGQLEGVTFTTGLNGYVAAETINRPPLIVPAAFYPFSLTSFVSLPVIMINFDASFRSGQVMINWQTASETSNSHFIIERSGQGNGFTEIGQVKGKGSSSVITKYSFTDIKPLNGKNFYRLKQMDKDGTVTIYKTAEVYTDLKTFNSLLYPNPSSTGAITLHCGFPPADNLSYKVFDISGRSLITGYIVNPVQEIQIGNLREGQYILKISNGEVIRFRKH